LLIDGSPTWFNSHIDDLHTLIDLMPTDLGLGLVVAGHASDWQEPQRLTRTRRAELHAYLEQACISGVSQSANWDRLIADSVDLLAKGMAVQRTIVILRETDPMLPSTSDWEERAADRGIVLLDIDCTRATFDSAGKLDDVWTFLPGQLGLRRVPVVSHRYDDGGMQLSVQVPAGAQALTLQWERSAGSQVLLHTPSGVQIDPLAFELMNYLYEGFNYTCLHLTPEALPDLDEWAGEWQISIPSSLGITVWINDPLWLNVDVQEVQGQRLLRAVASSVTDLPVVENLSIALLDRQGKPVLWLNDCGLNGDHLPADGIYSAYLPNFIGAGPFALEVKGQGHQQIVYIPASNHELTKHAPLDKSKLSSASLVIGLLGLAWAAAPMPTKSPTWRVSHHTADGKTHIYKISDETFLVGSDKKCAIILPRPAAALQFRLKLTPEDHLRLDVMSSTSLVLVNGERVFVSRQLEHGDLIQVADESLLVERFANLRCGKHL